MFEESALRLSIIELQSRGNRKRAHIRVVRLAIRIKESAVHKTVLVNADDRVVFDINRPRKRMKKDR